ncbi:MAG: alpha/beta hydrolase-fold protein [Bacteroidales bacterium]
MKKLRLIFAGLLCSLVINLNAQPLINILASFYSEALDEVKNVRIFLPGDYFNYPADQHYSVIYYLHGWTCNYNNVSEMHAYLQALIAAGTIDPVIMVSADNWVEPFEGSCYVNSILWGNYEEYNINDVINWVDATFRTIPERKGRAMIGQSMGGYGAFRYALKYKDKFCALAANGPSLNLQLLVDNIQAKLLTENSGPPYSYSYQGGGPYTRWMFLVSGAGAPNLNTPQTYINPAIVEYPFNEYCEPIDTILQKIYALDIIDLLHNTTPEDSVGIIYCCGMNDEWQLYEANAALADTLDDLGLPYEFYSHTGGHGMPYEFKQRALIFLDSLLMAPTQMALGTENKPEVNQQLSLSTFPNPVSHSASVFCNIPAAGFGRLVLVSHLGKEMHVIFEGVLQSGEQYFGLDTSALPAGVYFVMLQTSQKTLSKKLLKVK